MADATEKSNAPPKRRIGSIFLWLLAAAIVCAFYESIVLLTVGMIPTGIALVMDRSRHKDQARSVGYMNFAGCLPWAVDFWMSSGDLGQVLEIVGDPLVLAVMYTSAATGWALCFVVRPFVATYLALAADYREGQIRKRQEALVEEWGEEVRDRAAEADAD